MDRKKYIIEVSDDIQRVMAIGVAEDKTVFTCEVKVDALEELTADYINEHYGQMQDEAYQRGYEDGKKSVEDEGLRNNINLIVTQCGYSLDEINDMIQKMRSERT